MNRRSLSILSKNWLIAAFLTILCSVIARGGPVDYAAAPDDLGRRTTVWLDQGWTAEDRAWYYHVSQGAATLPISYRWFVALEQPEHSESAGFFSDASYLEQFGFITVRPDANGVAGLPIGFATTSGINPANGKPFDQLGFTCAACHTARLDYRGTSIIIDGGPAMIDFDGFRRAFAAALGRTLDSPARFERFAERVLGSGGDESAKVQLRHLLAALVEQRGRRRVVPPGVDGGVEEGYGRLDALNRIGNEVFATQMIDERNRVPLTAPVSYPQLWDTAWYDWVEYNSSIEQPMVRNAGEAIGLRAMVNFDGRAAPRFESTVPVDRLFEIESLLAGKTQPTAAWRFTGLRSPQWPEQILPPIDRSLAARGKPLYDRYCASCHLPPVGSDAFWKNRAWLAPNASKQRYLRLIVVPVAKIGTDPAQALDMQSRVVRVPLALELSGEIRREGDTGYYAYGPALGQIVGHVVDRWYATRTPPVAEPQRRQMDGYRPNGIRVGLPGPNGDAPAYKARPLNGIWATAPFLHNGSVPTLYDLLSPYSERPRMFWVGSRLFDPIKVGYSTAPATHGSELKAIDLQTDLPIRGNGNQGHLFETPANPRYPRPGTIGPTLTPAQRWALVEYIKTL